MVRTVALARIILGPQMNLQAPPNLSPDNLVQLIRAGINDWGGISPLTPDFINPEAPWPELGRLERLCADAGYALRERLTIYPEYARDERFVAPGLRARVRALSDEEGHAI